MNPIKTKYQNIASNYPMVNFLWAGLYALVINTTLFIIFNESGIINGNDLIKTSRQITIEQLMITSLTANLMAGLGFYFFDKYLPNGIVVFKKTAVIILACSCTIPFIFFDSFSEALAIIIFQAILVGIILYSLDNNFETEHNI